MLQRCGASHISQKRKAQMSGCELSTQKKWKWRLEQFHGVEQFCMAHNIDLTSAPALLGVELCVYIAATILFLTVERPFLQLRRRIAPRSSPAAAGK